MMEQVDISRYIESSVPIKSRTSPGVSVMKNILQKEIHFFRKSFSAQKKQQFYHDLNTLLKAGVDIATCLELLAENFKKSSDREVVDSIKEHVISGSSFSDAIKTTSKFSEYEYYTIRIGEETGQLNEILQELALYYNENLKLKKKLTSSLSYPVIVMLTAFGVVYFMISFIVPMFEDVFQRFGQDLPGITLFIIQISHGLKQYFPLFVAICIALFLLAKYNRKAEWYRKYGSTLVLSFPVVGGLLKQVYLARFSLCMFLLLRSRTPLLEAIKMVSDMIQFYPIQKAMGQIEVDILHGSSLYQAMSGFRVFDKRMLSMIRVAEESNQLDLIFKTLNDQLNVSIEQKTGILGNILEPILIIFIGLFVGIVLVSMYLPMFKLSTSFGF